MNSFKIFIGHHLPNILLILLAGTVGGGLTIALNYLVKSIFDAQLASADINNWKFVGLLLLVVVMYVAIFSLEILERRFYSTCKWQGYRNLFRHYMNKFLRADIDYIHDRNPRGLYNEFHQTINGVAKYYSGLIFILVDLIAVIVYTVIIFLTNFYAGLMSLAIFPVYLLLTRRIARRLADHQAGIVSGNRELAASSIEILEHVSIVKAENLYRYADRSLDRRNQDYIRHLVHFDVTTAFTLGMSKMLNVIAPLVIIFLAIIFSGRDSINTASILILSFNIPFLLANLSSSYNWICDVFIAHPAFRRLKEYDGLAKERLGRNAITSFESLETRNVKVSYSDKTITIPNFRIEKGEKVLIHGPSGSGKSTLFSILLGFKSEYEGEILVNGINLGTLSLASIRKVFGVSLQDPHLFALSLRDNITFGQRISADLLNTIIDITHLRELATKKESEIIEDSGVSAGEKARISLARALVSSPEVLLADEVFATIDEEMEASIIENIFEVIGDKTLICISHRQSSNSHFDRVIKFDL